MRILLAAMGCPKGDLPGNAARHLDLLAQARRSGCDLAVLPEMSLTGSVDPRTHPERLVTLDDPAVREVVDATGDRMIAALFGIAERAEDGPWITQVYAAAGRVLGVQRKRHLGEGEEGFRAHAETATFALGGARLGSIICAESTVPELWDASHAGGTHLLALSAAPGLDGRRTDEAGWRAGLAWWESAGLADARSAAARLEAWVVVATQAGSTDDEDFPGLAALVNPRGEVVARLPDWRPGTLVVDVPVSVEVEPVRQGIRILLVDPAGRTLLAQFGDDATGRRWWVPPGGGMEAGEDDLATARRELFEEVGRSDLEVGALLGRRGGTFLVEDRWLTQHERWYLSRCTHFEVDPDQVRALRGEGIRAMRWWSSDELRSNGITTGPRDLPDVLDRVLAGDLPDPTGDLGF